MSNTFESIREWLVDELARRRGIHADAIDPRVPLVRYGLDSHGALAMLAALGEALGRQLPSTLTWEHPTIDALAAHLSGEPQAPCRQAAANGWSAAVGSEPVAIVGVACRFPWSATPESFWRMLCEGVDAIREVPEGRWDAKALYDPDISAAGKMNTRWGGFIDDVERFDAPFFGISPREAVHIDPQQRLALELSWEALEDAGIAADRLKGSRSGVFLGAMWNDYADMLGGRPELIETHTATGQNPSVLAGRVSYTLGLEGPSMVVNTACSSSLVAVHLACQSLRSGESTLALAGGVNLILSPDNGIAMSKLGALAPDGRSRAFDARASGYVRGEGGGVVVLKLLSRAIADGDPIYCVIRGSAVNNDGGSNGLTAPSPRAQEAVLRSAYLCAGIDPAEVHYVETHGTGTNLGDPIEAKALGAVLGVGRPPARPLRIGSLKTNIGHLEAAAGVAGLIKVALAIKHRTIPPSIHFDQPNPHIPFADLRLTVQRSLAPWPASGRAALAGISSFGFSGTNCHVVIEAAPSDTVHLLPLSAGSPAALERLAREVREAATAMNDADGPALAALSHAGASRASGEVHRLALTFRSRDELVTQLDMALEGRQAPGIVLGQASARRRGPVFMFGGQGSQWAGMGRDLLIEEPVFRAEVERCDQALAPHLSWSPLERLASLPTASEALHECDVAQPCIFTVQVALAALWRSLGIEPAAVVGQSIGEVAAAVVAGALRLEDGALIICRKSQILRAARGRGAMAAVELPHEEAARAIAGHAGRLSVAIRSAPRWSVLSGDEDALRQVLVALDREGVAHHRVKIDYASHSAQMDPLEGRFLEALQDVRPRRATIPFYSTIADAPVRGAELDGPYWAASERRPVLFTEVVARMLADGHDTFLDVDPHPLLAHGVEQTAAHLGRQVMVAASQRRKESGRGTMLRALGALYARGADVRWDRLYPGEAASLSLPFFERAEASVRGEPAAPALLVLSAHTADALRKRAQDTTTWLKEQAQTSLRDVCFTASARRAHLSHRLSVVGSSRAELVAGLDAFLRGEPRTGMTHRRSTPGERRKVVFVFPGQGSQWLGMGRTMLAREPLFARVMAECDEAIQRETGWSLLDELRADDGRLDPEQPEQIDAVQPALFAIEVAITALWRSWGVEPDAVVGHSFGEIAAAHVSGALSMADAVKVICRRSKLLRRVSGTGGMVAIELPLAQVEQRLRGYEDRLSVGVISGPSSTVISGEWPALEEVLSDLTREGVFFRKVRISVASHSAQMEPLTRELVERLSDLSPGATATPMISTVTGERAIGAALDADYWARNLRSTVLFRQAIERLIETGHELFVEMSPHPLLVSPTEDTLRARTPRGAALASLRRLDDEQRSVYASLGALYCEGHPIDWRAFGPAEGRCVSTPVYPWQKKRYWLDDAQRPAAPRAKPRRSLAPGHPLLGPPIDLSVQLGARVWEQLISTDALPWLADHRVQGEAVLPGAAYLAMAWAAAEQLDGAGPRVLEDVVFERMLALPPGEERSLQTILHTALPTVGQTDGGRGAASAASLQISSRAGDGGDWVRHASGRVRRERAARAAPLDEPLRALRRRCPNAKSSAAHYRQMANVGLPYGPGFQGVLKLWYGTDEVLAQVRLPEGLPAQADVYGLHPALLDACFQTLVGLACTADVAPATGGGFVLTGVERATLLRAEEGSSLWIHGRMTSPLAPERRTFTGDLRLIDEDGALVADVRGLRGAYIARTTSAPREREREHEQERERERDDELLFSLQWRRRDRPEESESIRPRLSSSPAAWLVLADQGTMGAAICGLLRARGERCIMVRWGERYRLVGKDSYEIDPSDPEGFRALLRDAFDGWACRGAVHLWSLDAAPPEDATNESLDADQERGCVAVLHLVQALVQRGFRDAPPLRLVTRGTQSIAADTAGIAVSPAPLRALLRVVALENPQIRCASIDLGPEPAPGEAEALLQELAGRDGEEQIALRKNERYVARVVRGALASPYPLPARSASSPPLGLHADATYLITGGLGGLGLSAARWLVSRGARHVTLVGRAAPSEGARSAIAAIAESGAQITVAAVDVSRRAALAELLAQMNATMPPLRGILHAAGVLEDRTLLQMNAEQLRRVLAPKVHGAWNLHALTLDAPLDFFVLYSSMASLIGSAGQANYAAANAFLDALAHHRRSRGRCGTSINWGPFADVGLAAADAKRGARLAYRGLESLTVEEGLTALERLLGGGVAQAGVLRFNIRQWLEFHLSAAASPLWSELLQETDSARMADAGAGALRHTLAQAPVEARAEMLARHISEQVARVLHLDVASLDPLTPFTSLGMDSLMSLELRNHLESSLGVRVSSTLLFASPNVAALVERFSEAIGLATKQSEPRSAAHLSEEGPRSELHEHVNSLSRDELLAFLDDSLSQRSRQGESI